MKKVFQIILIVTFLIGIFYCETYKQTNLANKAYAALSPSVSRLETDIGIPYRNVKNENSVIAPIRKSITKTPVVPKVDAAKAQLDLIKKSGVVNIVFFGLDRRNPNEGSRSDSIMVISIDEKKQKIKVTSLMRDMYIPIPGKGNNRINAAYAFGGSALAIKTINTNFRLDIKDYVMVDFFGLEKLINGLGGVKINVSAAEAEVLNISENEFNNLAENKLPKIKEGNQTLNGRQAVVYCRIRHVGHADYERTERQRRVLNEILRKVKQNGITKLPKTISTLLPYVKTSLSAGQILKLGIKAIGFKSENIEQYRLPVDGSYKSQSISGMSVLVPNIEENRKKLYEFIYVN